MFFTFLGRGRRGCEGKCECWFWHRLAPRQPLLVLARGSGARPWCLLQRGVGGRLPGDPGAHWPPLSTCTIGSIITILWQIKGLRNIFQSVTFISCSLYFPGADSRLPVSGSGCAVSSVSSTPLSASPSVKLGGNESNVNFNLPVN